MTWNHWKLHHDCNAALDRLNSNLPYSAHLDVPAPNYIKLSKATPQTYILYYYVYRCLKTFYFWDPIPHKLNGIRLVRLIQTIMKTSSKDGFVTSKLGAPSFVKQHSIWPNRTSLDPIVTPRKKVGLFAPSLSIDCLLKEPQVFVSGSKWCERLAFFRGLFVRVLNCWG